MDHVTKNKKLKPTLFLAHGDWVRKKAFHEKLADFTEIRIDFLLSKAHYEDFLF
jgi:hypothetical protein